MESKILIALVLDKEKDAITIKNMLNEVVNTAKDDGDVLHYFDEEVSDKLLSIGALRVLNVPSLEIEDIPASEYLSNKPTIDGLHDSICVTRLELNLMGFSDDEEFNEHIQSGGGYNIYPCIYNEKVIVPDGEYFDNKASFNTISLSSSVKVDNKYATGLTIDVYLEDNSIRVWNKYFSIWGCNKSNPEIYTRSFYTARIKIYLDNTFVVSNDAIRCVYKGVLAVYNIGYIYDTESDIVLPNYLESVVIDAHPKTLINIVFPPSVKKIVLAHIPMFDYYNIAYNLHKDFAETIELCIPILTNSGSIMYDASSFRENEGFEVRLYG